MACVIYQFVAVIYRGRCGFRSWWGGELVCRFGLGRNLVRRQGVLELNVHRRRNGTGRRLAAALIAVSAALAVSGCSPVADYPSLFPAVHDMPPPRSDTTMDPLQV